MIDSENNTLAYIVIGFLILHVLSHCSSSSNSEYVEDDVEYWDVKSRR